MALNESQRTAKIMTFVLRPLAEADIPVVGEIEKEAFPTFWPRTPFKGDLHSKRISYLVAARVLPPGELAAPAENTPEPPAPPPIKTVFPANLVQGLKHRLFPPGPPPQYPPDAPLGYVSVWFLTEEAHITAIAVRRIWQGHGLGELLMIGSIETALQRNSRVVTLEVRVSNQKAILLYEKYGLKRVGIRKRYYTDNREDAAIMTTDPINTLTFGRRFAELRDAYLQRRGSVQLSISG